MTFDRIGDEELVERVQSGNSTAFSELFRRHQPAVARLVARMLGAGPRHAATSAELEDLVQDVFVQVYRSLESFRGQSQLSTWVYRIAVNVVLMHRRSARVRPTFARAEVVPPAAAPGFGPEDEFVQKRNVEALYCHLGQLSEKKRTVYILHEIEGLSPGEISKIVDAPVLTVRTRLFYARRELLASFREDPYLSSLVHEVEQAQKLTEDGSAMRIRTSALNVPSRDDVAGGKLS